MQKTFKKTFNLPVQFTMTDEPATRVICIAEEYINSILKEDAYAWRFFGYLEGLCEKISATVGASHIKFTFLFDENAKEHPEEIEEQMSFIVHNILRPKLHYCDIPELESKMFFETPLPNNFYKRNLYMEEMAFKVPAYGTNFVTADDKRRPEWQNQELQCGFDDRETWNLGPFSIEWLYSRLKRYTEITMVDMEAEKYTFKVLDEENNIQEVTMNMKEAANTILDACVDYLTLQNTNDTEEYKKMIKRMTYALRIWAELFPAYWW